MEKNARNITLFRCSKALYFHTFSKMFLSKFTLKNIYNTPQIFSGMLKIAPKALHFLQFLSPPPPPKNGPQPPPPLPTFPAASHPVYYSTKNNSCHFYSVSLLVYISNVLASLVVQFYFLCIGFTNIVDGFIIIFKYLKEIRSIIIKHIFQNILNKKVTQKL